MSEKRDRFYGDTVEERITKVAAELARDAIGLWQIVSFGREGFALSGAELLISCAAACWSYLQRAPNP